MSTEQNQQDGSDELDEYIVITGSGCRSRSRHRPADDETDEPACGIEPRSENGYWKRVNARSTIFYDDCENCFGVRKYFLAE